MTLTQVVCIVLVGAIVGLDLASVPQAMFSRPLVAGLLGGLVVGNPLPGLAVGALLELFALDTLPVGASRNPDWGPGSVAIGALAAAHGQGMLASGLLGLVLVAVVSAWVGGWLTHLVRRANVATVEALRPALDAGDARAIRTVQRRGLLRDAVRGVSLSALTLAVGDLLSVLFSREWPGPQRVAQVTLAATSLGIALYAGLRLAAPGRQVGWLVGGLCLGTVAAVLWIR